MANLASKTALVAILLSSTVASPVLAQQAVTITDLAARIERLEKENRELRKIIGNRREPAAPRAVRARTPDSAILPPRIVPVSKVQDDKPWTEAYGTTERSSASNPPGTFKASWRGFYAGAAVGLSRHSHKVDIEYLGTTPGANFDPPFALFTTPAQTALENQINIDSKVASGFLPGGLGAAFGRGITGSVYLGWNYQIGAVVLGFEGDFTPLKRGKSRFAGTTNVDDKVVEDKVVIPFCCGTPPLISYDIVPAQAVASSHVGAEWVGTLRGRVGLTLGDFLLFGTAGIAVGSVSSSAHINIYNVYTPNGLQVNANWFGQKTRIRFGWSLGGGIEYALTNAWLFRLEYLKYDLGQLAIELQGDGTVGGTKPWSGADYAVVIKGLSKFGGDFGRVGVSYKF